MEISQVPKQKTFVGNAEFRMLVLAPFSYQIGTSTDYMAVVNVSINDPENMGPFVVREAEKLAINAAEHVVYTGGKIAGKTWHETKDLVAADIPDKVDAYMSKLRIDIYVRYNITLTAKSGDGSEKVWFGGLDDRIGSTNAVSHAEFVKRFFFEDVVDEDGKLVIKQAILDSAYKNLDESMKSALDEENTRKENDLQLLRILTKRYPNFQELIEQ